MNAIIRLESVPRKGGAVTHVREFGVFSYDVDFLDSTVKYQPAVNPKKIIYLHADKIITVTGDTSIPVVICTTYED